MSCTLRWLGCFLLAAGASVAAAGPSVLDLQKQAWFLGRDYFVLRSGRTQMILQADQAELGPAFTYYIFDALNARQSARKDRAVNWEPEIGVERSALQVVLGGFPYTAVGHRTVTGWKLTPRGIPAVQATWWAGGVRVVEEVTALDGPGVFQRVVTLEGAHLAGVEEVTVRLRLPTPGKAQDVMAQRGNLSVSCRDAHWALTATGGAVARALPEEAALELGPLAITPGGQARVVALLLAEVPAGPGEAWAQRMDDAAGQVGAWAAATEQRWRSGSRLQTADTVVQGLYDRARFQLAGMVADDGTMDAGLFEYGAQWVRDTSNTALGALHAGQFEIVRATIERMLTQMVSKEGATMIANTFEAPDLEQFDQMGELMHLLKAYRDWTGDDQPIRQHRELLLALVERPLRPEFRDATGMVHNRREFWERTFTDAYELAYQTYVILGLQDAADLAEPLGAKDRAGRWRAEARVIREAVLHHPTRALVDHGHLIKRRTVAGPIGDDPAGFKGFAPDVPLRTERVNRLMPDASMALPLALGVIDARSKLGLKTLDSLESLWNSRWSDGGYDRYHTSSQPDQPGPWPFATTFIWRAQHEAGLWAHSRRSLEWLNQAAGGRTGAWYEEISSVRSQLGSCGLVPWTSGEVTLFAIRHYLGVRFDGDQLLVRPKLYPGSPPAQADLRFRNGRLHLDIAGSGRLKSAHFNGRRLRVDAAGRVALPAN